MNRNDQPDQDGLLAKSTSGSGCKDSTGSDGRVWGIGQLSSPKQITNGAGEPTQNPNERVNKDIYF